MNTAQAPMSKSMLAESGSSSLLVLCFPSSSSAASSSAWGAGVGAATGTLSERTIHTLRQAEERNKEEEKRVSA